MDEKTLKKKGDCGILKSILASKEKEMKLDQPKLPEVRPSCFGDEAKYVGFLEDQMTGSGCETCVFEPECGEFILRKCSRELIW